MVMLEVVDLTAGQTNALMNFGICVKRRLKQHSITVGEEIKATFHTGQDVRVVVVAHQEEYDLIGDMGEHRETDEEYVLHLLALKTRVSTAISIGPVTTP